MKKLLALSLAAVLAGCQSVTLPEPEADDPIRIGVLLPLSGGAAEAGESARRGIELAFDEIDPERENFELFYEDTMLDAKTAVTGLRALADWKKVDAILGPISSNSTLAIAPMTDHAGIPVVLIGGTQVDVVYDRPWLFRVWANSEVQAGILVGEALRRGYKKIAAISAINAYSLDLFNYFEKLAAENDIEIVYHQKIQPTERDFNSIMALVRSKGPFDAIFNNSYIGTAGQVTQKIRQNGIDAPIFGNATHEVRGEIEVAGAAAEGVWFPSYPTGTPAYREAFLEKFGAESSLFAPTAYDAARALATAFEKAGSRDPAAVRDALAGLKFPDDAASGATHFDAEGDAVGLRIPIREVRDGELVTISD